MACDICESWNQPCANCKVNALIANARSAAEAETVAAIVAWLRAAGDPPEGWDYTIADRIARGDWRPKPGGSHG